MGRAASAIVSTGLLNLLLLLGGEGALSAAEPLLLTVPPTPIGPADPPTSDPRPPLFFPETDSQTAVPPAAAPEAGSPPPTSPLPASCGVRYWIVSSRCAPQDVCRAGCGPLHVYERGCDGRLRPGSLAALQAQLLPGAPIAIFLHGAYVDWEDNLKDAEATCGWIRCACPHRPLNIIFYTWPSDQTRVLLAGCELKQLGWTAEVNSFYVAALLACLPPDHPVCLIGHSFGARMALATVQLIAGGSVQGRRLGYSVPPRRVRVVLVAAAVDHHWLNDCQRYDLAACYAEGILNLYNRQDCALKLYPLLRLFSRRALGSIGQTQIDRNRQQCAAKIQDCNVTGLVGRGHFWPNYYCSPQIAALLAPWVYFPDLPVTCPPASPFAPQPAPPAEPSAATSDPQASVRSAPAAQPRREPPTVVRVALANFTRECSREQQTATSELPFRPIRAWLHSP